MKMSKQKMFTHVMNVITVALIVECFLCAMVLVNKYGKENCFIRMAEITHQVSQMFVHSMEENQAKLTVFADILAANDENPDHLLQTYMRNFCKTQDFDAVCIHRAGGSIVYHGDHPHDQIVLPSFQEELGRLPYVSQVYSLGDTPEETYIYQAVPVIRGGKTIAVLYGYMTLDVFPNFISSTAYGGKGQFYIVDGDTGQFLMDEFHGALGDLYMGSSEDRKPAKGYDVEVMRDQIRTGTSGYFLFTSRQTGELYYTYYTPTGINNWSMMMSIDEPTAFADYHNISWMLMVLALLVIIFMVIHLLVLMREEQRTNKKDRHNLRKSNYMGDVQRALMGAHNAPGLIDQALKIVASEVQAETVLLLSFSGNVITNAEYWPSKDKPQAMDMVGRNIRDDFPAIYDLLSTQESVIYDHSDPKVDLSATALAVFSNLDVRNIMLVPIMDPAGVLIGAITAVNSALKEKSCEMLECVTYDFFMALSNLENHALIQRMGAMDYLTNIKNRNSYESEASRYATLDREILWCVFLDVNGLHEINNTLGHKSGDVMLCSVANALKQVFGEESSYRLGGDEFVAFATDCSQEEMVSRKYRILDNLSRKGYHVSIGFAGAEKNEDGIFDVESIISQAEARMYREKRKYYEMNQLSDDRGHFPVAEIKNPS